MSDLYTSLDVSPRKKRAPPEFDDGETLSPKRLRTTAPSHRIFSSRKELMNNDVTFVNELPSHLSRLAAIHTALQHALSHALATCAVSPTSDTGVVRNVLNHISLSTYTGFPTQFDTDDLRRLCWIWEWDGQTLPGLTPSEDDNPFLEDKPVPKDWTRGAMGVVLSPATHHSRADGKRVPAYGVGIEVEMDIDKDMTAGMAAVARWTGAAGARREAFQKKLEAWAQLHADLDKVPSIPIADLPRLAAAKTTSLTRTLVALSPKSPTSMSSPFKVPALPTSPSRSPVKSKPANPIPFPLAQKSPSKSSVLFPQTPRTNRSLLVSTPGTPTTPATEVQSNPATPVHQRGPTASTAPQTGSSSRRDALYERLRQRSLTSSPTKAPSSDIKGGKLSRDQMLKLGQDELRRRCLLGRLDKIAEGVWMLFTTPATGSGTSPMARKRRALPMAEVIAATIKSSPVPLSSAEAFDSLTMLVRLCPFFLKRFSVGAEQWLEMPPPSVAPTEPNTPSSRNKESPSRKPVPSDEEVLLTRSPMRVQRESGGLRQVREIIRRELELQD
ncbi:unnamed protein product [Mycena citricolor]|uniref:DNA replication factor Cdt1 C-terminal domain-containing protein n=1 Tax=Mycena citricolor TaxID=2018698 RepID=A0AAD2K2R9_9AGAR|nr:unnamed protein product [Mycena citricolor]